MSPDTGVLFRPFQIKSLSLKNRIVMAPMTRCFSPGGVPGENVAAYYRRRAEGGVGLILSEGTVIDRPASRNHPGIPTFHGDAALAGWKHVIDAVHDAKGVMGPQIWHVGSVPVSDTDWLPDGPIESPSGLLAPGAPRGQAMTEEDIADAISGYAKAAANAKRLGFDTVEIHGAHGYLIDEFFWEGTNLRTDGYGGATLPERSRFGVEVVKAVRAAVGPDFPVILRLSQWKPQDFSVKLAKTPDEMSAWLVPLREAGVDVFHCSQRRFWEPEFEGSDLNFAGWAKKLTGAATISVGSVALSGEFIAAFGGEVSQSAKLDELLRRMENEEFDLIAIGRSLISNPDWANKVQSGHATELQGFEAKLLGQLV
ncbi:MAG: NADH:flavin oxidoreductase [Fimbriimonas sp.]|nr:NADH:flavin oxidoreductase [Fimbriimonas sp.]